MLRECARPLADSYDAALVDLDGVLYLGDQPVPGAADAVTASSARGMRVVFVTNNASRTPEQVAERLRGFGVPAAAGDVVTSAQAVGRMLAERFPAGSPVLVVGAGGLVAEVEAAAMRVVSSADDDPVAVAQGFGPDVAWRELAEAAVAVRRGAVWIAANLDITLPSPRGQLPGNGALVETVRTAVGGAAPLVAGKPCLPLHAEATRRARARRPLVVGDRLETDIEGAVSAGVDSLCVLSGISGLAEIAAAPPERRPSYLGLDLRALLEPAPEVSASAADGRACCRDGRAELSGALVRRHGDALDAARAAVALCWALHDAGRVASLAADGGEDR